MEYELRTIPYREIWEGPRTKDIENMFDLENSSPAIKRALAARAPGTQAKDWKRTKKIKTDTGSVRVFDHAESGARAIIGFDRGDPRILMAQIPSKIEEDLIAAANQITHNGDYGELYWNPKIKEACLVLGDGGPDDPDFEQCGELLAKVEGVSAAEISAETVPFDDEVAPEVHGWISLGVRGKPNEGELAALKFLADRGMPWRGSDNAWAELRRRGAVTTDTNITFPGDGPEDEDDQGENDGGTNPPTDPNDDTNPPRPINRRRDILDY
jgi:hypothetical protein